MRLAALLSSSLVSALLLGGCSERVIATANEDVLVVVEAVQRGTPLATATVHYLMASPQPLSDDGPATERVVRMRYEAEFDCSRLTWGERVQELTMVDGQVLTNRTPDPVLERPSPGSVGESALKAVCDPDFHGTHGTRRPLRSIEKDYLERMGDR